MCFCAPSYWNPLGPARSLAGSRTVALHGARGGFGRLAGLLQSEEATLPCWSGKDKKCLRFLPSQAQAGREELEAMEIGGGVSSGPPPVESPARPAPWATCFCRQRDSAQQMPLRLQPCPLDPLRKCSLPRLCARTLGSNRNAPNHCCPTWDPLATCTC